MSHTTQIMDFKARSSPLTILSGQLSADFARMYHDLQKVVYNHYSKYSWLVIDFLKDVLVIFKSDNKNIK